MQSANANICQSPTRDDLLCNYAAAHEAAMTFLARNGSVYQVPTPLFGRSSKQKVHHANHDSHPQTAVTAQTSLAKTRVDVVDDNSSLVKR